MRLVLRGGRLLDPATRRSRSFEVPGRRKAAHPLQQAGLAEVF